MSLYGAFDQTKHFEELTDPLVSQEGVLTPATRQQAALDNLFGSAAPDIDSVGSLTFDGSPSGHAIDMDSLTLAANKSAIHLGSSSSPIQLGGTTDALVQFHSESAGNDAGGFDYNLFATMTGGSGDDNMIGIHQTLWVSAGGSPKTVQAIQGHCILNDTTASLATRGGDTTAGMYGAWLKLSSPVGSTLDAGSYAAAVWLDNQLSGTKNGTVYSIFSSSSATSDAWAGFADDAAGWTNLLLFEGDDTPPVSDGGSGDISFSGAWKKIAVDINGTTYYLVASASPS